jgi:transposase
MVRRSFAVRDIVEILMHWQAGRSLRKIARSLGVDRESVRKFVAVAEGLGYRVGETQLSAEEWAAALAKHAPELVEPHLRADVLAEIGRYRDAIVTGLQTNTPATVWQRLRDEQGLRGSRRSFYRYIATYLPEYGNPIQPTVLRDDPPPGHEVQIDWACTSRHATSACGPIRNWAKRASCGPSAWCSATVVICSCTSSPR